MIKQLKKTNQVFCTTRRYREVTKLAKLKKMKLVVFGSHGGQSKIDKLNASIKRTDAISAEIYRFKPDLVISFCSPEAARISFGLGIKHIAFCDSPHAEAVMRLSVPLVQKLLIPWIIPKTEFTKYGIKSNDIIPYKAIDASVIVKNENQKKLKLTTTRRNILIRVEEENAAYAQKQSKTIQIIEKIATKFPNENVMVLPRYRSQITTLKQLGNRIKILHNVMLGSTLLSNIDVFVGSGGTMTAEAALLGIPTISYNAVPNLVQDYLVRKKLVVLESDPIRIVAIVQRMLHSDKKELRKSAQDTLASMEDPYKKLVGVIKMINRKCQ
jgi:predicted glycosyltransferase